MTRILIVDDSATARLALRKAIELDSKLEVIGEAECGAEALKLTKSLKPDIVTMDVFISNENGLNITSSIMASSPRPILIVTGVNPNDPDLAFRAIEAGALDVHGKLPGPNKIGYEEQRRQLIRKLKALSKVPVVHRLKRRRTSTKARHPASMPQKPSERERREYGAILIGASTGGPPIIRQLLHALKSPFSVPIIIVQHITSGFASGFAHWLSECTGHETRIVDRHTTIRPGVVYLPADDRHMVFYGPRALIPKDTPPRKFQRPSVDELFLSAPPLVGKSAIGIILTGMGDDGKEGMIALQKDGALTIAQSPESCVVSSMPKNAIDAHAIDLVLDPEELPLRVIRNIGE